MSFNADLAQRLEQIASLLELTGADRFRVNAYAKAARVVGDQPRDLSELASDPGALTEIEGIGKKMAEKIAEFHETGEITEHKELLEEVPEGLLDLLEIPGLGPKTVALLWKEKNITDLAGLEKSIEDGSILDLPRMGKKTVENIKAAIAFSKSSGQRLNIGVAMPVAEAIVEQILKVKGVKKAAFAGSLRRGKESIGDIDILAVADDPASTHKAFTSLPGVLQVLASGKTKSSVRHTLETDADRWGKLSDAAPAVQVDLRVVPEASWGAAMLYFTGSKEHNVRMRERAIKRGMTLNEYGLYKADEDDKDKKPPQERGEKPVAGDTEQSVFKALDLVYVEPELREDRGEMDLKEAPKLVTVDDIKAELHAHTTESDGSMSLDELIQQAIDRGYHTIAVTDHSKSAIQANGLSVERLGKQRSAIEQARERFGKKITILAGSEVDILADGSLDYPDDVLEELDFVVASPHAALSQEPGVATKRLLKAIEHPAVRVLGHPTGRLINRRKGLEPAMDELFAAAKEHRVALEINAHWMRLDLRDTHVLAAVEAGCLIAINTDAHTRADFDNLRYGVLTARRGRLGPDQCVNTWSKTKLAKWASGG
ncbi:MAG: DNA polymerase/3'-5' exonuclease PolX [Phycisphaerales bacterium]|nr:DNA polymerase/3'-5' exonuclease PolX [Phycisphaerales bacterium]